MISLIFITSWALSFILSVGIFNADARNHTDSLLPHGGYSDYRGMLGMAVCLSLLPMGLLAAIFATGLCQHGISYDFSDKWTK